VGERAHKNRNTQEGRMSDGAMLELVSRGAKDAFFTNAEARRTWFGAPYERRSPSTRDIQLVYPEAGARFGHWVDIELPRSGDVLMSADIRIRMPSWLPPQIAALNSTHNITVESATWPGSFLNYGWTNGIANYLIQRWALYADNVMIVDGWGEFNSWFPDMETTQLHAPLIHATTGTHNGTDTHIQRNAVLPELIFRIPLIGCQNNVDAGLPICALQKYQRLYIRLWIADKTKLVESGLFDTVPTTDAETFLERYEPCPAPWGGRRIKINGVLSEHVTLKDYEVGQPYIYARYAVLNLDDETRAAMRSVPQSITFRQELRQDFTIEVQDFNPSAQFKQVLEIQGLFQALFLGIISNARLQQNKYRDINSPGTPVAPEWLINLGLRVNSVERIFFWPPKKFQELANNTQMRRDVEAQLYFLIFGINPDTEPAGPCNLSRTQKVLLTMQLNDVYTDPMSDSRQAFASVLGLSWNVFTIRDGYGSLLYSD
jgi:hypothetical protein